MRSCFFKDLVIPRKQNTLFGGFAKEKTYYNHKATSVFEQFVEAYYYFNKKGKTKEHFYKEATTKWTAIRTDRQAVSDYVNKHQNQKKNVNSPISKGNKQIFFIEKQQLQSLEQQGASFSPSSLTDPSTGDLFLPLKYS